VLQQADHETKPLYRAGPERFVTEQGLAGREGGRATYTNPEVGFGIGVDTTR
jgi:hypothetical protein